MVFWTLASSSLPEGPEFRPSGGGAAPPPLGGARRRRGDGRPPRSIGGGAGPASPAEDHGVGPRTVPDSSGTVSGGVEPGHRGRRFPMDEEAGPPSVLGRQLSQLNLHRVHAQVQALLVEVAQNEGSLVAQPGAIV